MLTFYAAEFSGIGYAPKSGAKVQKIFDIYKFLEEESADKMKIEKEITQNSYFDRCEVKF